ncbi:MAG: cyclic nucleotide-binding domain-containing protein [Defluviitaleaceae bacterium]|nr:cyclic nucleotide-binding domain-containing protein [Defluviitaleaceae bacterium]MCL2275454.1 cyclic nucleotide-binding domain-containing protein [Defluviitaleaceae bacterium]
MKKTKLTENDRASLVQYGLSSLDLSQGARFFLAPEEYLSKAGDAMDALYFVVSGKAKVFISLSDGRELLLAYFTRQGIIGEIELMTQARNTQTTVQAVTELSCIALPLAAYSNVLKSNIVFINYVAKDLAEKLAQRVVNSAITALQPLETRLCAYIFQTEAHGVFREKLTDVAHVMGASYRHLLRCLSNLCAQGVLHKKNDGYHITDRHVLEKRAGDMYVLK